ncbi:signal peptidase II [Kangiella geojedonensis]|uniref:Uncharacterized protein n=1 Tax=Kangiella geojedonensis TaxID=914150 RepID=A0A0F6TQU8_9GAMM|nr:signal peptidase II [Kangiella geojedonensis]AKE52322.1 hypothetical protein TQ33_1370 [Kangiella geojedonensis]
MINDSTQPMQLEAETVITTFENYGMAWGLYIGLTLLLAGLVWFAFRKQHFLLKWFFASVILAGALCFGHPAENVETYSPLILNTMVELFDGNTEQFMSDIKFIVLVWGILFIVGVGVWLLVRYLRKDKDDSGKAERQPRKPAKARKEKASKETSNKDKPMATPVEPTIGDDV